MFIMSCAGLTTDVGTDRLDKGTPSFFLSLHDHNSPHGFIIYTHCPCAAYFNDITHASILQYGSLFARHAIEGRGSMALACGNGVVVRDIIDFLELSIVAECG